MRTNWDEVSEVDDLISVPEGVYEVRISEVRETQTRDGHARWALRLEICTGELIGRTAAWDGLVWSERAMPRAKRILRFLGLPVEGEQELQPADLIGLRGRVSVIHEDWESETGAVRRRTAVPWDGWGPAEEPSEEPGDGAGDRAGDRAGDGTGGRDDAARALAQDSPF